MGCKYILKVNNEELEFDEYGLDYYIKNFLDTEISIGDIVSSERTLEEEHKIAEIHKLFRNKYGKGKYAKPIKDSTSYDDELYADVPDFVEDISIFGSTDTGDRISVTKFLKNPELLVGMEYASHRESADSKIEEYLDELKTQYKEGNAALKEYKFAMKVLHPDWDVNDNERINEIKNELKGNSSTAIDNVETCNAMRLLMWKYNRSYGSLFHSVGQYVVEFLNEHGTFCPKRTEDFDKFFHKLIISKEFNEANMLRDDNGAPIKGIKLFNTALPDSKILITSMVEMVLDKLNRFNAIDKIGGVYNIKENVSLFSEVPIKQKTRIQNPNSKTGQNYELSGIIDLIVVDQNGNITIYDWKDGTIENYSDYDKSHRHKLNDIKYQLAIYRRMLANEVGINENNISCKFVGFHNDYSAGLSESGEAIWQLERFNDMNDAESYNGARGIDFDAITMDNIDSWMMNIQPKVKTNDQLQNDIKKFNDVMFGDIADNVTIDNVRRYIDSCGGIKQDAEGMFYFWTSDHHPRKYSAASKEELENMLLSVFKNQSKQEFRNWLPSLRKVMNDARTSGKMIESYNNATRGENASTLNSILNKYSDSQYRFLELDTATQNILDSMGYLVIENTYTGVIDVVCFTDQVPKIPTNMINSQTGKDFGDYITARFSARKKDTDPKLLHNTVGARNAITTAYIFSKLKEQNPDYDFKIGKILTYNKKMNIGEYLTNEEIFYSMQKLYTSQGVYKESELSNVQLLSQYGLLRASTEEITKRLRVRKTAGKLSRIGKYQDDIKRLITLDQPELLTIMDESVDNVLSEELGNIIELVNEHFGSLGQTTVMHDDASRQEIDQEWYDYLIMAYSKAMGYEYNQDKNYKEASIDVRNLSATFNQIETAGNFNNKNLNTASIAMQNQMSNLRVEFRTDNTFIRRLTKKMEDITGYGWFEDRTFGFKSSMYENLFNRESGMFELKHLDDPTLSKEEKEYIQDFCDALARERWKNISIEDARKKPAYYWLPLMKGKTYTARNIEEAMSRVKDDFHRFVNDGAKLLEDEDANLDDSDPNRDIEDASTKRLSMWRVNDKFKYTDVTMSAEARYNLINKLHNESYWENDLENIFLGFMFEKKRTKTLAKTLPVIRAGYTYLNNCKMYGNEPGVNEVQDFIKQYVKVNVHRESIVAEGSENAVKYVNEIKGLMAKFALAFSPLQFTYQMLQGTLLNIKQALMNTISGGGSSSTFTMGDLLQAEGIVLSSLFHSNSEPDIVQLVNEIVGLNNVNMKRYVESVSSNRNGIQHIGDRLMMIFAERPDLYNRTILFVAQAIHDGYWDALSVVDRELVYDFKKDRRFAHINSGDFDSAEGRYEYGLYMAMAREFVQNGVKYSDGKKFEIAKPGEKLNPLPLFLTSSQMRSMKDVGDLLYGYYDDINKSLWSHTFIGGMFFNFRSYWPAKKNEMIAARGIKLRGEFKPKVNYYTDENGKTVKVEYFFKKVDGKFSEEITTNPEEAFCPLLEWKGDIQNGFLGTCALLIQTLNNADTSEFRDLRQKYLDGTATPEELQIYQMHVSNLVNAVVQIFYFSQRFVILGAMDDWIKKLKKQFNQTSSFVDALICDAGTLLHDSLDRGFLDFNFMSSFSDPLLDWSPMFISKLTDIASGAINCMLGDSNAWDTMVRLFSGTRQFQNTLETIKPDYINIQKGVLWSNLSSEELEARYNNVY